MSSANNWAIPTDARAHFQNNDKRLSMEERRPRISKASDLLGPLAGPRSVLVNDLNSQLSTFNGWVVIQPGAVGSPDPTKWWVGFISGSQYGGMQLLSTFKVADQPHVAMKRSWDYSSADNGIPLFSSWSSVGGSGGGWGSRVPLAAYAVDATVAFFDIRRNGKDREIRGNLSRSITNTTSVDVSSPLPTGDRPSETQFAACYIAGGYPGMVFLRPTGVMAINNMSTATRSGGHQFTLKYSVD